METMRAAGERSTFPCAMRGTTMSPANCACPRFSGVPATDRPITPGGAATTSSRWHPGQLADRVDDASVACAADVPVEAALDHRRLFNSPVSRSAATVSSIPGVQKPHWRAAWRVKASSSLANSSCSARPRRSALGSLPRPRRGSSRRTRPPSTSTVHVPHTCISHERLAPVSPSRSRARRAAAPEARSRGPSASFDLELGPSFPEACRGRRRLSGRCGSRRPSTRPRSDPGTCRHASAPRRSRHGRSSPNPVAIACSLTARSSVIELRTAQRTSASATTTPWLRRITARRWPSASATARP